MSPKNLNFSLADNLNQQLKSKLFNLPNSIGASKLRDSSTICATMDNASAALDCYRLLHIETKATLDVAKL